MLKLNIDLPGLKTTGYAYTGWTTTPPTEPGWYWAIPFSMPDYPPRMVVFLPSGRVKYGDTGRVVGKENFANWQGPLPVPEPPTIDANPNIT
jgi:hypothetical protein